MRVNRLDFNAGSMAADDRLSFEPSNITIFVGPNNGGKSTALREINNVFTAAHIWPGYIFDSVYIEELKASEIYDKIRILKEIEYQNAYSPNTSMFQWRSHRQEVDEPHLMSLIERKLSGDRLSPQDSNYIANNLTKFFVLNLGGENRLSLTNPSQVQHVGARPISTVHAMFQSDELRGRLRKVVKEAFNMYLAIDPLSLHHMHYVLAGEAPASPDVEKSLGLDAISYFKQTVPVHLASDGTRAFIGILAEIIAGDPEIMVIDEPEAFLHPGLAYQLGRQIGLTVGDQKQLFAATHSPHFLMGCLSSGATINIVRLTYRNGQATARLLPSDDIKKLMFDPLLRSVGVLSAIFYESAIIVEGDSDRAFYDEINIRLQAEDRGVGHAVFLIGHSKQACPEIVMSLRKIGVPTACILDIDWIKEGGKVCDKYLSSIGVPVSQRSAVREHRRVTKEKFCSLKENFKRSGGVSLLEGSEAEAAHNFFDQMDDYGLFTVRKGELESWLGELKCRREKSTWITEVFRSLGGNPESKEYILPSDSDVWSFMDRIARWLAKPDRKGMTFPRDKS